LRYVTIFGMQTYTLRESVPDNIREQLAEYPPLMQELLHARGIGTADAAKQFLQPDYEAHFHDPFLLPDMERAVQRIYKALQANETIIIYSDYDMDGGPGGVILHDFFKKIGYEHFKNYIPHRHEEGYGLNVPAVEGFAHAGAKLLITVDCGITDTKPVAAANKLGIDVIITDHHLPITKNVSEEALPDAYAIINPKRKTSTYPFDGLCGAGIAFKLVQALLQKGKFEIPEGWEKWLLDMAGLATIADMVPLRGENRALAHFGLVVLRKSPRPGLQQLCRKMRTDQRYLTEDDVGFMIGPRINAASRMGEAMDAFRLLSTTDEIEAGTLADHLNHVNDERKGVVAGMAKEIKRRIKALGEVRGVLVMGDPRWRPSLLGLAANSLVEEYQRPVFLWGREGSNIIKGSCRSDGSVDVVALMSESPEMFIDFGGHRYSGGFSVPQERVHELEAQLLLAYERVRTKGFQLEPVYMDKELSLDEVTWQTYGMIAKFAPFGMENPKPAFLFKDATIAETRYFGRDKSHLELRLRAPSGTQISAIKFFAKPGQFKNPLAKESSINLVATFEKSMFKRMPELRLRIVDIL